MKKWNVNEIETEINHTTKNSLRNWLKVFNKQRGIHSIKDYNCLKENGGDTPPKEILQVFFKDSYFEGMVFIHFFFIIGKEHIRIQLPTTASIIL